MLNLALIPSFLRHVVPILPATHIQPQIESIEINLALYITLIKGGCDCDECKIQMVVLYEEWTFIINLLWTCLLMLSLLFNLLWTARLGDPESI